MTGLSRTGRRRLFGLVVAALLAAMAVAMVTAARQQTPTIDEPVYVAAAVDYQQQHRLRYNPEHPPLGKLLIAIGTALDHPRLEAGFRGDQTQLGRHLLYESGNDPGRLMLLARLPVIVLTLLFGLVVLAFATDLAGRTGGLLALTLYTFSPDLIAHGSLATLDVPAAGFLLTAAWLAWRVRRRPVLWLPLVGLALGAALATRMSTLPAVPVVLALAVHSLIVFRRSDGERPALPPNRSVVRSFIEGVLTATAVAAIAVLVVWASYAAVDPRLRWTSPPGLSGPGGLRGLVIDLLPLPEPYRDGLRLQFDLERQPWGSFLFGRSYQGSVWYYLPCAVLVKTPLGMLLLWTAGAGALLTRRLRPAAPYLLALPLVLFAMAMAGHRDFGVRYSIFLPMFLAVAAGCLPVLARWRSRPLMLGGAALAGWVAVSSLLVFPYYLTYSNEAFGGPAKTHLRLHDSNVDWGQDLGRLATRLREHYPGQSVWLVYKGSGVPSYYGIRSADPRTVPLSQVHGLVVVSDSAAARAGRGLRELIASSRAIEGVGHSITIYRR